MRVAVLLNNDGHFDAISLENPSEAAILQFKRNMKNSYAHEYCNDEAAKYWLLYGFIDGLEENLESFVSRGRLEIVDIME